MAVCRHIWQGKGAQRGWDMHGRRDHDSVNPDECSRDEHLSHSVGRGRAPSGREVSVEMSRTDIDRRIAFINPFGTAAYDAIIEQTLVPYASRGTTVDVVHL